MHVLNCVDGLSPKYILTGFTFSSLRAKTEVDRENYSAWGSLTFLQRDTFVKFLVGISFFFYQMVGIS